MTPEELMAFLKEAGMPTKEDLELLKSNPQLAKYVNSIQAGVDKKFQTWASELKAYKEALAERDNVLEDWDEYGGVGLSTEREVFPKPQIDQGSAVIGKAQGFHQVTLESLIGDEGHLRGIGQFNRWLSEVDQAVDDHASANRVFQR